MKKILAVVLALALVLSMGVVGFAAGSPTVIDVTGASSPAAATVAEVAEEPLKIEDGNGEETPFDAAEAVENVDAAIARLEKEDSAVAEALKAFFEKNKDNVGQGVITVPEAVKSAVKTANILIPVRARGVKAGDKVTVILCFPDGTTKEVEVTCEKAGVVYIPVPVDAKNVGYVIKIKA